MEEQKEVKEIKVSCPKCKTAYTVPMDFVGQAAECGQCDSTFVIPNPEDKSKEYVSTETGTISAEEIDKALCKHTVKISRHSVGMIPNIKDRFEFGTKSIPPKDD
jgi:hypothetical protein